MYLKLDKTNVLTILIIKIVATIFITFVSYNAGVGDGKVQMIQELAKCTIKNAHEEKCFIPCSEDIDCLMKNGMKDH